MSEDWEVEVVRVDAKYAQAYVSSRHHGCVEGVDGKVHYAFDRSSGRQIFECNALCLPEVYHKKSFEFLT